MRPTFSRSGFGRSILGCLVLISSTREAHSGAIQSLFAPPLFDSKPELTFRSLSPPVPKDETYQGLKLDAPRFTWKGNLGPESWVVQFSGQLNANSSDSLIYFYNNEQHPIVRGEKGRFTLHLEPEANLKTIEFISVDNRGNAKKEKLEFRLEPLPEMVSSLALPRYELDFRAALQMGYDHIVETNTLATSRMSNIRFPKLFFELGVKRGRLTSGASWRAVLLGGAEYSFPLVGLGVLQMFPLSWNLGLQVSRERILGRLGVWFLSPFLQLERQGWTFASSYLASLYSEPSGAISAASIGALWVLLGTRFEVVLLKRNWELVVHVGRTLTAVAWSNQGTLDYRLGGYTARLSIKADLSRHLFAQATGHYDALIGSATVYGGGFGMGVGFRY